MVLLPWGTRDDIAGEIQQRRMTGCVPTLCLSGDEGCPSLLDLLVLDLDVKEGTASAAVFASSSGRGRHAVARLDPQDLGREHYRGLPPEGFRDGARLEIFPAGTRRHVVWHRDRQLAGPGPDDPLPRVPLMKARIQRHRPEEQAHLSPTLLQLPEARGPLLARCQYQARNEPFVPS